MRLKEKFFFPNEYKIYPKIREKVENIILYIVYNMIIKMVSLGI